MTIVRHLPANDNSRSLFDRLVERLEAAMRREVEEAGSSFGALEVLLLRATNEAVRRCLQSRLQSLADALGDEIVVGTEKYRRHQPGRVK